MTSMWNGMDYSQKAREGRAKARAEYMADVEIRYAAMLRTLAQRPFAFMLVAPASANS